ncbi:restriction endonuclease subunit S [Bifidobacterium adolescentis]|uniref:restriction endonuclease subunit S n=1 Tax=Bifidobacterium adolescentis TaxID=1680 RepID=UPI0034A1E768
MAEQHEKALVPQIRFTGFTDPWEQRKLGELCSFSKGCGYSKNDLRDQGTPIILYGRLYTNYETQIHSVDTFVKPLENSVYSEGGEVIIPASGETAEDISIASVVEKPGIILGGDLNVITSSADIDPVFLALELSYGKPHFDLAKRAQGKSVVHIHNEDIANVFFGHPNIAEQRRIGAFFDRLDSLITLHQRKYDKLCVLKKSMLDKMFPKGGSLYPEIRFAGFTDPWEQRKLGELFEEHSEKDRDDLPALTIIQGGGTVHRDESNRNLQFDRNSLSNYKVVDTGDFIVHLRSFEGGLEKATCCGLVSPAYHIFRGKNVDSDFYYLYFRSKRFIDADLKPHVYGIRDGRSIDIEGMKTIFIPWTNLAEQRRIGAFFDHLDSLITLHQRKLELLRNIKKSMLDKMFV